MQLETIVRYLRSEGTPFRLTSYPSPEPEPVAGHPTSEDAVLVRTRVFHVDAQPVLVACRAGDEVDVDALARALGAIVTPGTPDDLPDAPHQSAGPVPPLGQLAGMPVVLDERVAAAAAIVFQAGSENDYFQIPFEDFARQEQPRLAPFARAGGAPRKGSKERQ